ncbi:MAG: hypothetical protein DWQ34_10135, partial [Planctomycetota bacterium]
MFRSLHPSLSHRPDGFDHPDAGPTKLGHTVHPSAASGRKQCSRLAPSSRLSRTWNLLHAKFVRHTKILTV